LKNISVINDRHSRITAESSSHVQIENWPRESQHLHLGRKPDSPAGARVPGDLIRHVDEGNTVSDHLVLQPRKELFEHLAPA